MTTTSQQDIVERTRVPRVRVVVPAVRDGLRRAGDRRASSRLGDRRGLRVSARARPLPRRQLPDACGLVQLHHSVSSHLLYDSYWYRSGINRTMTDNLHEIARQASELIGGLDEGDLVLDIGCNDGTLFDGYPGRPGRCRLSRDRPVRRDAVRRREGLPRRQRPLRSRRSPGQGGRRPASSPASRCSTTSSHRAAFVADIAAWLAHDGVWVGEFCLHADDAGDEQLRHGLPRAPGVLLAGRDRAAARRRRPRGVPGRANDVNGGSIRLFAGHARAANRRPRAGTPTAGRCGSRGVRPRPRHRCALQAFKERSEQVRDDLVGAAEQARDEGKRCTSTAPPRRATRPCSTAASTPT